MQFQLILLSYISFILSVHSMSLRTFESAVDPISLTEAAGIDIIKILNLDKYKGENIATEVEESEILKHKMKKTDIANFENYFDSYLKLLRKFNKYRKKSPGLVKQKEEIVSKVQNLTQNKTDKLVYKGQNMSSLNNTNITIFPVKTIHQKLNKTKYLKVKLNQSHSGKNLLISNLKLNHTNQKNKTSTKNHTQHPSMKNSSITLNSSIDFKKNTSSESDSNVTSKINNFFLSTHKNLKINKTANNSLIIGNNSSNSALKFINKSLHNKTILKINNRTEIIHKNNSGDKKFFYRNTSVEHPSLTNINITKKIQINNTNNKIMRKTTPQKSKNGGQQKLDEIYENLKTKTLNEDFERREMEMQSPSKDNNIINAENIENNIYNRIINISISLILIGLLMGIFLGLILVMYFSSKK